MQKTLRCKLGSEIDDEHWKSNTNAGAQHGWAAHCKHPAALGRRNLLEARDHGVRIYHRQGRNNSRQPCRGWQTGDMERWSVFWMNNGKCVLWEFWTGVNTRDERDSSEYRKQTDGQRDLSCLFVFWFCSVGQNSCQHTQHKTKYLKTYSTSKLYDTADAQWYIIFPAQSKWTTVRVSLL